MHFHRRRRRCRPDAKVKPPYPVWYSGATFIDYDRDRPSGSVRRDIHDYDMPRNSKTWREPELN